MNKELHPSSLTTVRDLIRELPVGGMLTLSSNPLNVNSIRTAASNAILVMRERGYMTKKLESTLIVARYL